MPVCYKHEPEEKGRGVRGWTQEVGREGAHCKIGCGVGDDRENKNRQGIIQ